LEWKTQGVGSKIYYLSKNRKSHGGRGGGAQAQGALYSERPEEKASGAGGEPLVGLKTGRAASVLRKSSKRSWLGDGNKLG